MRTLAIGDIHGYADVLRRLLDAVRLRPDDQVVTLGDYVDRGPDARGVIEELLALQSKGQLIALRGNHDSMMLDARKGKDSLREWIYCGGRNTLVSYGDVNAEGRLDEIPERHWKFLEEDCVDWYETDTHLFVHANFDPNLPMAEQPLYLLHWEALYEARPHCSGKVVVCGHTKQRSGLPQLGTYRLHRHLGIRRWLADVSGGGDGPDLAGQPPGRTAHRLAARPGGPAQGRPVRELQRGGGACAAEGTGTGAQSATGEQGC